MKKFITALILLTLVFTLISCNSEKPDYTFENLEEDFVLLSEAVVSSTLPAPYKSDEGFYEQITGRGVLYGETESEISIKSTDGMSVNLIIDGEQCILFAEGLEGAQIVDIDTSDGLNELALYSAGPSMDPTINLIRFDGKKITPLSFVEEDTMTSFVPTSMYGYHGGTREDVLPTYGAVYTNKHGKILNSMQYTGFSEPMFVLSYYELKSNNTFERKELNKSNIPLPAAVKAAGDFHAFFTPMDKAPENFEDPALFNNFENPTEIKKDTEFKILDYGKCYNYYAFFIELEGGETGVITFWTGD